MNCRIKKLKERILEAKPTIESDRAVIATQVFQESESDPAIIRRAKLLEAVLTGVSTPIFEDELIVGSLASGVCGVQIYPDFSWDWVEDELDQFQERDPGSRFYLSEEDKAKLRGVLPYWRGKAVLDKALSLLPAEIKRDMEAGMFASLTSIRFGIGHIIVDYEKVLRIGLKGLKREVEQRISRLNQVDSGYHKQKNLLDSMLQSCDAVIKYACRYGERARQLAVEEKREERRKELQEIERICKKVPEEPAETFQEALQSFWLIHLAIQLESNGVGISPGRFDQYMWPFLKKDLETSVINEDQARELLACLWLKFNEVNVVFDAVSSDGNGPYPSRQNLVLGGQTRNGKDATNPLSFLCLEVTEKIRLHQPSLSVRFHANTPNEFLRRAVKVIKTGTGLPAFYNDEVIIPALLSRGATREDARNYALVGCSEPSLPGKSQSVPAASKFNLPKCLELALTNGVSPENGEQIGELTGNVEEFTCFGDFIAAFTKQVAHFVDEMATTENIIDISHREVAPLPLLSSLVEGCIFKALSINEGGAVYNFTGPQGVGLANTADSLAAVKKTVYDDQSLTWPQLMEALYADFEGYEETQKKLLFAPKFGNDDDYVDLLAREVAQIYANEVEKYRNPRGGVFHPGMFPATAHIALGRRVMATPDGRNAKQAYADGISPAQGRDKKGMTAALNSVLKLDHLMLSNGIVFNQKVHPMLLNNDKSMSAFLSLLRTYFLYKGMQIQFNVLDSKTLRDAQANPDQYRDLVVRVAGWSAFFVLLDRSVQEDIIARTHQAII